MAKKTAPKPKKIVTKAAPKISKKQAPKSYLTLLLLLLAASALLFAVVVKEGKMENDIPRLKNIPTFRMKKVAPQNTNTGYPNKGGDPSRNW